MFGELHISGCQPRLLSNFNCSLSLTNMLLAQVWSRNLTDAASNTTLDVEFSFPVSEWLVAREDYHRWFSPLLSTVKLGLKLALQERVVLH